MERSMYDHSHPYVRRASQLALDLAAARAALAAKAESRHQQDARRVSANLTRTILAMSATGRTALCLSAAHHTAA
jgi:hypothetical protein